MNTPDSKAKSKLGLSPGTPIFTGIQKMLSPYISLIQYSEDEAHTYEPDSITEALELIDKHQGVSWLNIDGLHELGLIEQACKHLGVHKLTIEDILSVDQRPKLEENPDNLHLVVKMLGLNPLDHSVDYEQLSFLLKGNLLVSFQEKTGDAFVYVRKRIAENNGLIRKRGADYLLYALLDSIVDMYFVVLEHVAEKLTDIETELLEEPTKNSLAKIHNSRKELLAIRGAIFPLREVISRLDKIGEPIFTQDLGIFIRDLYDHTLRVLENIESYRDAITGLLDLYMNSVSQRMNEIMKVLTIIATIFIPLTFIAGIYGMNFDYMPELHWRYSYYGVWALMILIFLVMLWYFWKKKWF